MRKVSLKAGTVEPSPAAQKWGEVWIRLNVTQSTVITHFSELH